MRNLKMGKTVKRWVVLLVLSAIHLSLSICPAWPQGILYFRNFSSTEYGAHNQNFDIVTDDDGTVYVANFEGLLYFDNSHWRIIHTPGITRLTKLFRDSKGTLWTGGYNFIGRVVTDSKGCLQLKSISKVNIVKGEVLHIWEADGQVFMHDSDDKKYILSDSTITPVEGVKLPPIDPRRVGLETYINQVEDIGDVISVIATNGEGVVITDKDGKELSRLTEANGLCSGNVAHLAYNGHGLLWGATDNGIFAIALPSVYTRFTASEGLRGEVLSIAHLDSTVYVGTSSGLYFLRGKNFVPMKEVALACWQLVNQGDHLLAATADGLYVVNKNQRVAFLTTANTLSVLADGSDVYTGEMDGVYLNHNGNNGEKVMNIEKVVRMVRDDQGTLWLQNIYGRVWSCAPGSRVPVPFNDGSNTDEMYTLVSYKGRVTPVSSTLHLHHSADEHADQEGRETAQPDIPFPLFSYADNQGILWLTDNKGKRLYAMKDGERDERMTVEVFPLMDYSVRAMVRQGHQLWMGGDKGLIIVDTAQGDPCYEVTPRLLLRSVMLHGDSVVWGGYGSQPTVLPDLPSKERHVVFSYSIDFPSLLLPTQYRTRINGGNWSSWESLTYEEYSNITYGNYRFEVQARDAYGRLSEIVGVDFTITPPFYLRWYMLLFYLLLLAALVYGLFKFRLYKLEKDKHRLEAVVKERTADLVEAQHELVRQEKMATVGKLTQGLIDRILNPLNYINNFAKLSENLVNDAIANIEDEKEKISTDNYEDTMELLSMLKGNLQKVGEHGANTSRVLKAMEEMLKDRTGGQVDMSLKEMLLNDEQMLQNYYKKEMTTFHIDAPFSLPEGDVRITGNADLLNMAVMSLLRNAVYAVKKKCKLQSEQDYHPEVALKLSTSGKKVLISIRDNGIGIESTIIDRIFDPFFTTKTTGEASGVGLYISREIVQNHGGDITVTSEKGEYTEFIIMLPLRSPSILPKTEDYE